MITLQHISKSYGTKENEVKALNSYYEWAKEILEKTRKSVKKRIK